MGCVQSMEETPDTSVDLLAPSRNGAGASHDRRRIYNDQRQAVKVLLLGARDSGKSTVLKQMKLIYDGDYTLAERETYSEIILSNIIESMKVILRALPSSSLSLSPINQRHVNTILDTHAIGFPLHISVASALEALSTDPVMAAVLGHTHDFQLPSNASSYLSPPSLARLVSPMYVPTTEDILRSSTCTSGIFQTNFILPRHVLNVFDFGGSRSERKKWVKCFEGADVLFFVAAMSEYDEALYERDDVNRIAEALILFDSISNSRWFTNTPIILLLNKIDILAEKLPIVPLSSYFPKFQGRDFDDAADFLRNS
ncbi:hypothetical protein DXG01_011665, partial [Tephrocybe rancida]